MQRPKDFVAARVYLPPSIHSMFRIWCFQNQLTMQQALTNAVASMIGLGRPMQEGEQPPEEEE